MKNSAQDMAGPGAVGDPHTPSYLITKLPSSVQTCTDSKGCYIYFLLQADHLVTTLELFDDCIDVAYNAKATNQPNVAVWKAMIAGNPKVIASEAQKGLSLAIGGTSASSPTAAVPSSVAAAPISDAGAPSSVATVDSTASATTTATTSVTTPTTQTQKNGVSTVGMYKPGPTKSSCYVCVAGGTWTQMPLNGNWKIVNGKIVE